MPSPVVLSESAQGRQDVQRQVVDELADGPGKTFPAPAASGDNDATPAWCDRRDLIYKVRDVVVVKSLGAAASKAEFSKLGRQMP
jgi:hypothetical protein